MVPFLIDQDGAHVKCEKRLIEQALALNREGRMLATVIDEASHLDMDVLRKLRLMLEDFPKNHNLILFGQSDLLARMSLKVNDDIKSRITYSVTLLKLNPDDMEAFVHAQMDKAGLGHNTFTPEAIALIPSTSLRAGVRSADGILRRSRNLCLSCLLEAVRARTKTIGIEVVNKVLIQPHWRNDYDMVAERSRSMEAL